MGACRNLRDDAAERRMGRDLAHNFVGENLARAIGTQPDYGRRRLVASGFDAQDAHPSTLCSTRPN